MKQRARLSLTREGRVNKVADKKKQFIIFGLCSLVALALCLVTLVVVVKQVEKDNSKVTTAEDTVSKTQLSGDEAQLSEYIYNLTTSAVGNKFVKINKYTDVSVDDGGVKVYLPNGSESANDASIFSYAKNYILPFVDSLYGEDYTGEFGKVYDKMPVIALDGSDMVATYHVGQVDDEGNKVVDDQGNHIDSEFYFITYTVRGESVVGDALAKTFGTDTMPDIKGALQRELSSVCSINSASAVAGDFVITAKINRLTDEISSIAICKSYTVTAEVTFKGDLAVFGEKTFCFPYSVTDTYEYFYAGVTLSENEASIEEGNEINLTVNAVIENDSEYEVTFSSSDESVATVDEMGYVKGIRSSDEPVTITVTLRYMGETFTDTCIVHVTGSN